MTLAICDFEQISPERANDLWAKIQDGVIDDFNAADPRILAGVLTAPSTVCFEHENGMSVLSGISPRLNADIHFWSWNHESASKIIKLGREVAAYAFETYKLERMTATVPSFNKFAINIAMRLGFRYEGCVRHAFLYHGKYHDVNVYGILRSEYERGPS